MTTNNNNLMDRYKNLYFQKNKSTNTNNTDGGSKGFKRLQPKFDFMLNYKIEEAKKRVFVIVNPYKHDHFIYKFNVHNLFGNSVFKAGETMVIDGLPDLIAEAYLYALETGNTKLVESFMNSVKVQTKYCAYVVDCTEIYSHRDEMNYVPKVHFMSLYYTSATNLIETVYEDDKITIKNNVTDPKTRVMFKISKTGKKTNIAPEIGKYETSLLLNNIDYKKVINEIPLDGAIPYITPSYYKYLTQKSGTYDEIFYQKMVEMYRKYQEDIDDYFDNGTLYISKNIINKSFRQTNTELSAQKEIDDKIEREHPTIKNEVLSVNKIIVTEQEVKDEVNKIFEENTKVNTLPEEIKKPVKTKAEDVLAQLRKNRKRE